jgi:hypothetical protein
MKPHYMLAKIGGSFYIVWKNPETDHWQQYGTKSFPTAIDARKHAAICTIIINYR